MGRGPCGAAASQSRKVQLLTPALYSPMSYRQLVQTFQLPSFMEPPRHPGWKNGTSKGPTAYVPTTVLRCSRTLLHSVAITWALLRSG